MPGSSPGMTAGGVWGGVSRRAAKTFHEDGKQTMTNWVYSFGGGKADGRAEMKALLGGKGANLAEMSSLGLPVPPGFTITTEVCTYFYKNDNRYPDNLEQQVNKRSEEHTSELQSLMRISSAVFCWK